jgi:hypothetical protein
MKHALTTFVVCSVLAGGAMADANSDLYYNLKKSGDEIPQWLVDELFPMRGEGSLITAFGGEDAGSAGIIPFAPGFVYTDSDNTVGAADDLPVGVTAPTSCNGGLYSTSFDAGDKWYTFTLPAGYTVSASTCNAATYDTCLGIFDASGTLVAADDDGAGCSGFSSLIEGCCLEAGTYYVVVDGYSFGDEGSYTLSVEFSVDPCIIVDPCDTFTTTPISLPYHGTGSNVGAQDIYGSVAGDVAYTFTLTADSYVELATCFPGTGFDTDSHWFTGNGPCDPMSTYLGYNDGESACSWATHVIFDCDLPLTAGTYTVIITGYTTNEGDFEMDLHASACGTAGTEDVPVAFELGQAFPNPFNPSTTINFTMGETANANLTVYNMAGQAVATLVNGIVGAGSQSVVFDASNLTSGVYVYTLTVGGQSMTEKMVLVK